MSEDKEKQAGTSGQQPGADEEYQKGLTRRRFLTISFAGAATMGLAALGAPLVRYAYPVVGEEVFEKVKVATVGQLKPLDEGVKFDYQEIPSQLLMMEDGSYVAVSRVCTHLGCIVKWETRNSIYHCPCHAGKFTPQGDVISGPPPRPLTKLKVKVEGDGIFVEGIETEEKK